MINNWTIGGVSLISMSIMGSLAVNRVEFRFDPNVYSQTGDIHGAWVAPDVRGPVNLLSWAGLLAGAGCLAAGTRSQNSGSLATVPTNGIDLSVFGDTVASDGEDDWAEPADEGPDFIPAPAPVGAPVARVSVAPSRLANRKERATGDWVKAEATAKEPNGGLAINHWHSCGVTGSGKTTVVDHMISCLAQDMGLEPIIALINPKHVASRPEWRFEPICKNIDDVLIALEEQVEAIKSRLADPDFDPTTTPPLFVIVDEWDWIYEEFKGKATSVIRKIFKTGRSVRVHVFLCGQSPLASDTGMSGSDYKNMGRIIFNSEALAFLSNPQLPYDKDIKQPLYNQALKFQEAGIRFCLFIGIKGLPEIREVPHLVPANQQPVQPESDPWEVEENA